MNPRYEPLLRLIRDHESEGAARKQKISAYDVVWGGIKPQHRPSKPLRSMTVGEVLLWQDSIDSLYMSEAAGAYQIMEDTLRSLVTKGKVKLSEKFDEATQDRLAIELLEHRGLTSFMTGKISDEMFAQNVSMEWASLPCVIKDKRGRPATGQSYYAGDGLNKSSTSIAKFLSCLASMKAKSLPPLAPAEPTPAPGLFEALLAALIGALKALGSRKG